MTPLLEYVRQAIQRISTGAVDGSHASGVFNRAANGFEKAFAGYVATTTKTSNIANLTLGQLIHRLDALSGPRPPQLAAIIADAKVVNRPWRKVKHGAAPPEAELVEGLAAMQRILPGL
jgi:hypothetical protein